MWKLVALVTVTVSACLLPFTVMGVICFGPLAVATFADRFCRG